MMMGGDNVIGQSADKSGQHTVSPAPVVDAGESGSRRGWTDPPPTDAVLYVFDEFFRACVGRSMFRSGGTEVTCDELPRLVVTP